MGRYRKIDPRIWNDMKFRTFTDNAKLAFLFILTHPHMTSLGAMRATIAGLAEELHWEQKAFLKAFREPLSKGMLKYDSEAACLVVPNFLKYNPPENPNVVKSWEKIVDLIPECILKNELYQYVKAFLKDLGEPFLKPLAKELERVWQNPNPNPSPNPIKEKAKDIASPKKDNGDALSFYSCPFFVVDPDYRQKLKKEYPVITDEILRRELSKMDDWVSQNRKKKKFKANGHLANSKLFIKNWLDRIVVQPTLQKPADMDEYMDVLEQRELAKLKEPGDIPF